MKKCTSAWIEERAISILVQEQGWKGTPVSPNLSVHLKDALFYYRDIDQKEVDLIYWKNQKIIPIQIKKGINPSKPDKNFNVLKKYNYPIQKGFIIDTTDKVRPINENVYSLPVGLID